MSFGDTYKEEVLQSRRTRSQRAGFWAKVVSFVLMIVVAATLRSEPELRHALIAAGTDGVLSVTGRQSTSAPVSTPTALPHSAGLEGLTRQIDQNGTTGLVAPFVTPPPENGIKINRLGRDGTAGPRFKSVTPINTAQDTAPQPTQDAEAQEAAETLGRLLQNFNVGG